MYTYIYIYKCKYRDIVVNIEQTKSNSDRRLTHSTIVAARSNRLPLVNTKLITTIYIYVCECVCKHLFHLYFVTLRYLFEHNCFLFLLLFSLKFILSFFGFSNFCFLRILLLIN